MVSYNRSDLFNELQAAFILPEFSNTPAFDELALKVFNYQQRNNPLYASFLEYLNIESQSINTVEAIPFLPIEFFKNHIVKSGTWEADSVFKSSGTGQSGRSQHHIRDLNWYGKNAKTIFEQQFGKLCETEIFALLPSYLDQGDSSLIHMVDYFHSMSANPESTFYLNRFDELHSALHDSKARRKVLFGVTYALLDFAEYISTPIPELVIIETGGMKGRREEITREELHKKLIRAFSVDSIFSEYGMTELLSQAYTRGGLLFTPSSLMRVMIRDVTDPFCLLDHHKQGAVNIIDLANLDTCAFIATDDLGITHNALQFEILGRIDNSDIRGCSLLS